MFEISRFLKGKRDNPAGGCLMGRGFFILLEKEMLERQQETRKKASAKVKGIATITPPAFVSNRKRNRGPSFANDARNELPNAQHFALTLIRPPSCESFAEKKGAFDSLFPRGFFYYMELSETENYVNLSDDDRGGGFACGSSYPKSSVNTSRCFSNELEST